MTMRVVAFQGDHGAFSEEAALSLWPSERPPVTLPLRDFAAVGDAVRAGTADFGVLPIENSIHGSVTASYDVLGGGGLRVVAERIRPIDLCVLARPGSSLAQLRRVISHPVALNQCGAWLARLPQARAEAWYDTAGAAREVAEAGDPTVAAVAGRHAGEHYGLEVLAAGIQDRADNATRFFLVTRAGAPGGDDGFEGGEDGGWKAVLMMEADHQPGALVRLLVPFAERGVNLTRIESRPADEQWRYRFFVEIASADGSAALLEAAAVARREARRLDVLGCFPA
jgi:prephenate dehydratase